MAALGESISHEHEREFAELRRSRSTMVRFLMVVVFAVCGIAFLITTLNGVEGGGPTLESTRSELLASGLPSVTTFTQMQVEYGAWLERHGTTGELALFNKVSGLVFSSAAGFAERFRDGSPPGLFSRLYFSLHGGLLRVSFLIIAAWRLWFVASLGVMVWTFLKIRPYLGADLLGTTGNKRLFYSGARVDLSAVTESGAPDILIPGLACPTMESPAAVRSSGIGKCLSDAGAANDTTIALAGMILKRGSDPAYVADPEEQEGLQRVFEGASLREQAELNLAKALELHAFYRASANSGSAGAAARPAFIKDVPLIDGAVSPGDYAFALQAALHRVLTPQLRRDIALLTPADIAVLVLGLEAGKIMVHVKEGGRWIRRSRFPQLCSRSLVHSLPSFAAEFDAETRQHIRRAFVYGSRKSDFAPVRFPLDFSPPSRAARQWVEILMAAPHQLGSVADEVELLALVTEGYHGWSEIFFNADAGIESDPFGGAFASHGNLFLMPLPKVLGILRRAVTVDAAARIETLMASVSNKQRLQAMSRDAGAEAAGDKPAVPVYDRVLTPLTHAEVKALSDLHGVSADDLRAWSALRLVLNSFGWLARRVGDNTVPDSSLVAAVMLVGADAAGANALGLAAERGLVPLRGTHLETMWGRGWRTRFQLVDRVRTGENSAEIEKLLRGIDDRDEELNSAATVA